MELKQTCKWMVGGGTLLIWMIKYFIRPLHIHHEPIRFFLGIAPNLFGSFLIPFGAYWFFNGKNFMLAKLFRIHSLQQLGWVCMLGFLLLVVNEYLQLIPVFGRTFDYFDITFSAMGLIASYFLFGKLWVRYKLKVG
jgi:hypothetical protein